MKNKLFLKRLKVVGSYHSEKKKKGDYCYCLSFLRRSKLYRLDYRVSYLVEREDSLGHNEYQILLLSAYC